MRTVLPPDSLAAGIRTALRPIDPNLPVSEFQTLQDLVDKAVSPRRFLVMLLAGFAGFALLLASLGIYALISYSVNQRTKEIGIRMALGASAGLVQREVLTRTLRLAVVGVALGTLGFFRFKQVDRVAAVWHNTDGPGGLLGRDSTSLRCRVGCVTFQRDEPRASTR